jgi:chorismate mutase-like protein
MNRLHFLALLFLAACATTPRADLPALLVERLSWMDDVARYKQARQLPVEDAPREAALLDAMAREGQAVGLPPNEVRAFFAGQIEAAKQVQRAWLQAHANEPTGSAPLPDLAGEVRPALDDLGRRLIAALAEARRRGNRDSLLQDTRERLRAAGYDEAVSQSVLSGLLAGLGN